MDDNYKKAINEHRQGLENDLIVLNFVSSLHEVCKPPGFLNDREIGTIKDARTRYDKVGELLDLLLGKGNNAFESFCVILSKNGYAGWATKLLVSAGIDRGGATHPIQPSTTTQQQSDANVTHQHTETSFATNPVQQKNPPVEMEPAMGADSPRDWKAPNGVYTYKHRKPNRWGKYWNSVLRRSKQIHFRRLSIELLMSSIMYFLIVNVIQAIYPEVESQALESGQADSSQSFPTMMLEVLTFPKRFMYYHIDQLTVWKFLALFIVVKLIPKLYSLAMRLISSKDSKKERKINGSNLLSFNEKLQALKGLDKAMCNIFRDTFTASGFVIRYEDADFLVTSIHSFFEGDEVDSTSDQAYKLLLPDGLNLSEKMKKRFVDTYSFEFCSGTKHGQDILHNSEGIPNLFANAVRDILVLRLRYYPKGVKPIDVNQLIKYKPRAEWVNAAVELLGYHEWELKYSSGTILPTDNAEVGCFHYCASTEGGFSGGPVLVAVLNAEHSQFLCPLAVHTKAGKEDEPYNVGSYLWPFLLDIKELKECWKGRDRQREISTEEKEILDLETIVVRSMTF